MNPGIWGRIEPVRLTAFEAARRIEAMLGPVRADLAETVRLVCLLEEGEKRHVAAAAPTPGSLAAARAGVQQALAGSLALSLARLYEFGTSRSHAQDARDVASLPFLLRLCAEQEVQAYYTALARGWSEEALADENEAEAQALFAEAFGALVELERDPAAVAALARLDALRDRVLAHTLMQKQDARPELPSFSGAYRLLVDHGVSIFAPLETALTGHDSPLPPLFAHMRAAARAFWRQGPDRS